MSPMRHADPPKRPPSLSADGRELLGRPVDVNWSLYRPDRAEVRDPHPRLVREVEQATGEELPEGRWIAWDLDVDADGPEKAPPPSTEGLLDEFLALESGPDEAVVTFMVRWGSLGFCPHLRAHHCLGPQTEPEGRGDSRRWLTWEPIAAYRGYATLFRELLTLASELEAGEPGDDLQWAHVIRSILDDAPNPISPPVERQELRHFRGATFGAESLVTAVDMLMVESPVDLGFELGTAERSGWSPSIRLFGTTFGLLAYQLAIAVQGGLFAICSSCRRTYAPVRKPQAGRDNYCAACRGERKRAYKRRQRQPSDGGR